MRPGWKRWTAGGSFPTRTTLCTWCPIRCPSMGWSRGRNCSSICMFIRGCLTQCHTYLSITNVSGGFAAADSKGILCRTTVTASSFVPNSPRERSKWAKLSRQARPTKLIVLCAHLCHPHQVNDDLTGVVVGMEVMRSLLARQDLRYTYRFVIVPETIGSVAWLSHNENLIPRMKGGLFLEMLGRDYPHALQLSHAGDTELDQCFALALRECDASARTGRFRTVVGNDERQFNAPGVRVPMLSLSRVLPSFSDVLYFPEYHSNHDTPDRVPAGSLEKSRDLVLRMLDTFENNLIPHNRFKGEVFCSRYGLHIDAYANPEGNRALLDIINLVDGTKSLAEIAIICGVSFESVQNVIQRLHERDLVQFATPSNCNPIRLRTAS